MTEKEKMTDGLIYNPTDPVLLRDREQARIYADKYNRSRADKPKKREKILNQLLSDHGTGICIEPPFHVDYGYNIHTGENFYMNFNGVILDVAPVYIGDGVMCGPNVSLVPPMHPLIAEERMVRQYPDGLHDLEYAKPITIEDNVWLATNVTVCGGVTIGKNSVIAAGSVVTKDIPANSLAAGVPCKVLRSIRENDKVLNKPELNSRHPNL